MRPDAVSGGDAHTVEPYRARLSRAGPECEDELPHHPSCDGKHSDLFLEVRLEPSLLFLL